MKSLIKNTFIALFKSERKHLLKQASFVIKDLGLRFH